MMYLVNLIAELTGFAPELVRGAAAHEIERGEMRGIVHFVGQMCVEKPRARPGKLRRACVADSSKRVADFRRPETDEEMVSRCSPRPSFAA
jgi:hypothetical protein